MRLDIVSVILVLAAGCGGGVTAAPTPRNAQAGVTPADLPAISDDGALAVVPRDRAGTVGVVSFDGGDGRVEELAAQDVPADLVTMRALDPTGEWSGFAGDGGQVSMDESGRRLFVDLGGTRIVDVEAPWWTSAMPDQAGTHANGACADESVEIMAAWIAPAQRRVLLAVQVDFPPCHQTGGFYLVGW